MIKSKRINKYLNDYGDRTIKFQAKKYTSKLPELLEEVQNSMAPLAVVTRWHTMSYLKQ